MKNPTLSDIVSRIRNYPGVRRKNPISRLVNILKPVEDFGDTVIGFGDDTAAVRFGDEYLLFSSDGIWERLHGDPSWAGYCSVLVNVNDIYAMGGRPLAMTNSVSYTNQEEGELVTEGIREACEKFRVPMVGGHTHPESDFLSISVSVVGRARELLTSMGCKSGDDLILAIDVDGTRRGDLLNWDSTSSKTSDRVLDQLSCLPEIAERKLANAGKDISNPGILGTIGMLLEICRKGALVNIDDMPRPEEVPLDDWLLMYPGYGFVLSSSEEKSKENIRIFEAQGIEARVVGRITEGDRMVLRKGDEESILFDFATESITGIGRI